MSNKIEGIYRLQKSKDFPNPASSSDGMIVLYDSAFGKDRSLGQIVAHELSHQKYKDFTEKERQDYSRVTGWYLYLRKDRNFYWEGRSTGYIQADGRHSPEEDFANNLEHFLFSPDKLKSLTPEAFSWFSKKFGENFKLKGK